MSFSKENTSETFWFRLILIIGVIAIPFFGIIMGHELPGYEHHIGHRIIIAAIWLSLYALSFISPFVKKRLIIITCWLFFLFNIWAVWTLYVNHFTLYYCVGFLNSLAAMNIVFRRPKLYYCFYLIIISAALAAAWISPAPEVSFYISSFTFIILGIVFTLSVKIMIDAEQKLNELNLTLEKKVAERTAEAENKSKLLISKNMELEQFAYVTSHDLKSPLRNIGGFAQLIQRKLSKTADEEIHEYIGFVVNNVKKMSNIIDDIMLYSRFGAEATTFKKNNIEELVQDVCKFGTPEIEAKNASIRYINLSRSILCNREQLEQVFQNLIENALKYNETTRPDIEISMQETQNNYLFSIKDNGIGIGEEYQEKVFKMFQRLHTDQEYQGTGIGLAICKRIVENHGGEIWVESTPGKGSTFFFTIHKNLAGPKVEMELAAAFV